MSKRWLMWLGCGVMVLGGAYFLWIKGYQNILGYGMLLLCPLMHLFMHGAHGHGDHAEHSTPGSPGSNQEEKRTSCH